MQFFKDEVRRPTLRYRQCVPEEVLSEIFASLSRIDLAKAAMACRRYRDASSESETLCHLANLVIEPVGRGRRFGSRHHSDWPVASKASVVLWYELGPEHAPGAYKFFQTVPNAVQFVAQKRLLQRAYVENLVFRQTDGEDMSDYVWKRLGNTMSTAEIGHWTIDGLRLEWVVRHGNFRYPFDAVKSLRSYTISNCPYLRIVS